MVPPVGSQGELPRLTLPPAGNSPSVARQFATARLREWGLPACEDTVTLLVSELVTNALLHARTEMVLAISRADSCVLVEVTDGNGDAPTMRTFSLHAGTGRGLHLVATLARDWGVRRLDAGKTVWAEISTGPEVEVVVPFDLDGIDAL